MSTRTTTANVVSLLATLGFDARPAETKIELVIDQFDTWTGQGVDSMLTTCICTSAEIMQ